MLSQRLFGVSQALCEFLYRYNSCSFSPKPEKSSRRSGAAKSILIIEWMTELCELLGDAAKWTIGKVFYTPFRDFKIPFEPDSSPSMFFY